MASKIQCRVMGLGDVRWNPTTGKYERCCRKRPCIIEKPVEDWLTKTAFSQPLVTRKLFTLFSEPHFKGLYFLYQYSNFLKIIPLFPKGELMKAELLAYFSAPALCLISLTTWLWEVLSVLIFNARLLNLNWT